MLFVSKNLDLKIKLRSEKPIYTPQGDLLAVQPKIKAEFRHGSAPQWAIDQAIAVGLYVTGKPDGFDPQPYYSSYDTDAAAMTEAWDDQTRDWVEKRLLSHASYGHSFIRVEPVRMAKPWPAYDKLVVQGRRTVDMVAQKIAETVSENGYDPDTVIAYEAENLNRPEVLAALAALAEAEPAEDLVEA